MCTRENKASDLDLGFSGNNGRFNSALIISTEDLEETALSPAGSPGVGNKPVWRSTLSSPSDDLDSMSSESLSGGVLVNSALVLVEVFVDSESSLSWSIGHDFGLNSRDLLGNSVSRGSEVLVLSVSGGVSRLAAQRASRSLGLWAASRSAWGNWIWLASSSVVVSSSDNSLRVPPSESLNWVSSLTSVSAR